MHDRDRLPSRQGADIIRNLILAAWGWFQVDLENRARKQVGSRVSQLPAVQIRFLFEVVQGAVRLQEGDAEAPGFIHGMHQQSGGAAGQGREIARSVEVVAVQGQKALGLQMRPTGAQGIAGPPRCFLPNGQPLWNVRLFTQEGFDLIRQVMDDHQNPIHGQGQGSKGPVEDRPAGDGQERLGRL